MTNSPLPEPLGDIGREGAKTLRTGGQGGKCEMPGTYSHYNLPAKTSTRPSQLKIPTQEEEGLQRPQP